MRASICLRSASVILKLIVGFLCLLLMVLLLSLWEWQQTQSVHPRAAVDYSFLVVKVEYICHEFRRSNTSFGKSLNKWVGLMNNVRSSAEETLLIELIYV